MADIGQGTTLQLSADELRVMTKWPDSVIFEFLSLQRSVAQISQVVSIVVNEVNQSVTQISQVESSVQKINQSSQTQQQQIAALSPLVTLIVSLRSSLNALVELQNQQTSVLQSEMSNLRAELKKQMGMTSDLEQLAYIR